MCIVCAYMTTIIGVVDVGSGVKEMHSPVYVQVQELVELNSRTKRRVGCMVEGVTSLLQWTEALAEGWGVAWTVDKVGPSEYWLTLEKD